MENLEKYFSVSEAAKLAGLTSETLRHYDRIGLAQPGKKDDWTGYRRYTRDDIIRLQTISALRQMELPLGEIRKILDYDDFEKIIAALDLAQEKADEKIAKLQYSKAKIQAARVAYEKQLLKQREDAAFFTRELPQRVLLLSDTAESPTLDTLWNYLSPFYQQLPPEKREQFDFEDMAGIYTEGNVSRLFAVCIRHGQVDGLKLLPSGTYLCANCTQEDRDAVLERLLRHAKEQYRSIPSFAVQLVVLSGILQWKYQIQLYIES